MTLCAYESRSIHAEFARLENGRYKGSIVVRTLNGLARYEIDLHCEHERDTATEALADAEKLAKEFEERELHAFAFSGPAGSSAQCVALAGIPSA